MRWLEKIRSWWRQLFCWHLWHVAGELIALPGGPAVVERCARCPAKRVRGTR